MAAIDLTPLKNADEIRDVLATELARIGCELVKYEGRSCYFWVRCPDGKVRLDYLYKGINRFAIAWNVRQGFEACQVISP